MNIFKQLVRSLYSPKDIATFRFQGIGKTILFIFFLSLISIIPTVTYLSTAISSGIQTADETIKEEFPDFTIEDGELISDETAPVEINKQDFTIYFDSTGELTKEELNGETNALALLKNEFVFVAGGTQDALEYATLTDFTLTKDDLTDLVETFDGLLPVLLTVLGVTIYLFSSAVKFIEVTILALFGLLFANVAKRSVPYRQLWRMSAYSVVLPTIFFTIMEAIKTNVPGAFLLNWVVAFIMLYLAIREIPQKLKK